MRWAMHPELTAGPALHARRARLRGAAALLVVALAVVAVAAGALYSRLPSVDDAPSRVATLLAAHGGIAVRMSPSSRLARAVVAVEDRRYFDHGAIDPVALGRVVVDSALHPGRDPGGSTIAQQFAKVAYDEPSNLLGRLEAIGLAFKLEHRYSKARILDLYLNAIYYGHGYWGAGRASFGYFGRSPAHLSWPQAALLAGLPQAPSLLDPITHPAAARARRAVVLHELERSRALTPSQAGAAAAAPLV